MKRRLDWFLRSNSTRILFEDDHVIAVDKPSGLLVLPDRYDRSLTNLYEGLRAELGEIFLVHRIDKETSGVILFAKTAEAHAEISKRFEARSVDKTYAAIVEGTTDRVAGDIVTDIPVRQDRAVVKKSSETRYRVVARFQRHSFVEVKPVTGRTHQIRIHLRSIGLPIVADALHGDGKPFYLSQIKSSYRPGAEDEKPLINRVALHASQLAIAHPLTEEILVLRSDLPKDMRSVLRALQKYSPSGSSVWEQRVP
jgi:RluA family pseudouridine synthase